MQKYRGRWPAVRVPVEVHHVVKIAWPRAFSERAQFFSEGFLIGVAIRPDPSFRSVAVRMKYLAPDRGKHEPFIGGEVELDLRPAARSWRHRSTVRNFALEVGASAGVVIDVEFELVGGNIQTRLFRHPGDDLFESRPQEFLVEVFFIAQGKIQIF